MKLTFLSAGIFLLLCAALPNAYAASKMYYELDASYGTIKLTDGKFNPWLARMKFGYNITDNFSVEGHYATGVKDDTLNSLNVELKQMMAGYIRWGSNTMDNVRLYILLGQARTTLNWDGPTKTGEEQLDDFTWAVGAEERSKKITNMYYTAEYASYFHKGNQDVTTISLGLRFDFL